VAIERPPGSHVSKENPMNEKRNDRQQGGRDGGMNRERKDQNPDRTRTGQVGGGEREDTARQGQRQKGGIGQPKPDRDIEEDLE
jgi:hypothetical protein